MAGFRRGSTTFDAIKRGSTTVTAVYYGANQIWPEGEFLSVDTAQVSIARFDAAITRQHLEPVTLGQIAIDAPDVTLSLATLASFSLGQIAIDAFDVSLRPSSAAFGLGGIRVTGLDAIFVVPSVDEVIILTGDMQTGADELLLSGDQSPGSVLVTYPVVLATVGQLAINGLDISTSLVEPLAPSGDMQSGTDLMIFSGDETGIVLTRS